VNWTSTVKISVEPSSNFAGTDFVKLIAFYLPQFHPIPENDNWWGKGFTEWTNVTKAKPLFEGHYQPRLPADLGFYDLRLSQIRHEQIALAKQYGIYGFCYHYYWFSGSRLLEKPIYDMLLDPASDMPFCLCWANENWTRRWDGREHELLIAQKHAPGDDEEFIRGVVQFFRDPRYIRLNGAPLLIVYQPQQFRNSQQKTKIWREVCTSLGIPKIHLCAALTHGNEEYQKYGFDSGVQFPPHNLKLETLNDRMEYFNRFRGRVYDYCDVAKSYLGQEYNEDHVFKSVFPSWDNTARRNDCATIVLNATPENYEYWLSQAIKRTSQSSRSGDQIVFINAWNEWAEGCYLEPDQVYQTAFLESTLRAAKGQSELSDFQRMGVSSQIRVIKQRTLFGDLGDLLQFHGDRTLGRLRDFANQNPRLKKSLLSLIRFSRMMFRWN
jgi:lipopolysaccharide biosynthesis protein